MQTPNNPTSGVCAIPDFERNNYFYGKLLTVRDLMQEQCFFNEKRRLINRMVLGWGVVCGLDVHWDAATHELVVSPGLALDVCGREILVCEPARIRFEPYEEHCQCAREKREPPKRRYILCLDYCECKREEVELPPLTCDDQARHEYNRIRESFRLRIKPWEHEQPPQEVGLAPPEEHLPCLNIFKTPIAELSPPPPHHCFTPTLHDFLCEESRKGCPKPEGCPCVVLAVFGIRGHGHFPEPEPKLEQPAKENGSSKQCVTPTPDDRPPVWIDACRYRRLVYPNPLLYNLIHCHHGDLPHIVDFSWRQDTYPTREIDWRMFCDMVTQGLTLTFDQPMKEHSLNPETFIITFYHTDEGTGALVPKRIPAGRFEFKQEPCFAVRWKANEDWIKDELNAKNSLLAHGVTIEILVRGSRVLSEHLKALDGAFIAGKLPTGNGVQGTDFVDWFRVRPRGEGNPSLKELEKF